VKKIGGYVAVGVVDSKIHAQSGDTACAHPGSWMYAYHGYVYTDRKGERFGITESRFNVGDEVGVLLEDMNNSSGDMSKPNLNPNMRQVTFYHNGVMRNGGTAFVDVPEGKLSFCVDLGTGAEVSLLGQIESRPEDDPAERSIRKAKDALYKLVDKLADRGQLNGMLWQVYDAWDISGDGELIDGRMTWKKNWADVQKYLTSAMVDDEMDSKGEAKVQCVTLDETEIVKLVLFANEDVDSTHVTWGQIQRVIKAALEPNVQYAIHKFDALNEASSLVMRKSGFVKKLRDMGPEKSLGFLWRVYDRWPIEGDPKTIGSLKSKTWSLSFVGES